MYKIYTKDFLVPFRYLNKIPLAMRLTTLILIITIMQVSAGSFAQRISLQENNAPLTKIFRKISQQSGYDFFMNNSLLKSVRPVTINITNAELSEVLTILFENQPIGYTITERTIVVTPKNKDTQIQAPVEEITIYGIISDENGRPLQGASVRVKNSGVVSISDQKGRFSLRVPSVGDSIVVSYVGYVTQTLVVGQNEEINITLKIGVDMLNDVKITTGYQVLSKQETTGSFGKPDMKIFAERVGTNDIVKRLEGLVPGLTVLPGPTQVTGNRNGNGASQQQSIIRGKSSINILSDPLYVVNGIQVTDLSALNPDDIADVTILKDASAAAIWGAKAANGIIVIVTKKGTNQKLKINYNGNFNFQGKPDLDYAGRHLLSSSEFIQAGRETFSPTVYPWTTLSMGFIAPHELALYDQSRGLITIAQANSRLDSLSKINNGDQIKDLWFRNAYAMNHTVSASGGNQVYNFYSSLSYTDNQSNQIGSSNDVYRINLSQDITPNNWLKISLNTSLNNTLSSSSRPISIGAGFLPYQLFRDASGNNIQLNYVQGLSAATRLDYQTRSRVNLDYSPLDEINAGYSKSNNLTINTSADIKVKLWKGLSFDGTYGYQKAPGTNYIYDDISKYSQRGEVVSFTVAPTASSVPVYHLPNFGGRYQTATNDQRNWTLRNQLIYNTLLRKDKDRLNIQLGQEAQESLGLSNISTVRGYNQDLGTYPLLNYQSLSQGVFGAVSSFRSVFSEQPYGTYNARTRFTSYFGLLNYLFAQKYSLDASVRQDKSNLFASDESSQKKPAYSLGGKWSISKEPFMRELTWVEDLGLRATYGVTGNSPYLGAGSIYDILQVSTNSNTGNSLTVSTPANNKLTWESTRTFNLGLDFSLFNYRISGSVEVYQKNTKSLLGVVNLNPFTGFSSANGNLGNLRNKGIEVSLRSVNIQVADITWSTNLSLSYNNNKLLSYIDPSPVTLTDTYALGPTNVGYSTPSLFAYKYAGLDNTGDPQIMLADGSITKKPGAAAAKDLVYMGSVLPKFNGGLSNTFRYKTISLTANIVYSMGGVMRRDVNTFYSNRLTGSAGSFSGNINNEFVNRWKKAGDEAITNIPSYEPNQGINFTRRNTAYYTMADINVVSASFVKLRDITLAYSLSPGILKALKVSSANLFVQTGNFMLWKNNKYDIDPEYQIAVSGIRGLPSFLHTYNFGLNVSF